MGLSRNKVAVSEGAAGSPPFYGERDIRIKEIRYIGNSEIEQTKKDRRREEVNER